MKIIINKYEYKHTHVHTHTDSHTCKHIHICTQLPPHQSWCTVRLEDQLCIDVWGLWFLVQMCFPECYIRENVIEHYSWSIGAHHSDSKITWARSIPPKTCTFFRLQGCGLSCLPNVMACTMAGTSSFNTRYCADCVVPAHVRTYGVQVTELTCGSWLPSDSHRDLESLGSSTRMCLQRWWCMGRGEG